MNEGMNLNGISYGTNSVVTNNTVNNGAAVSVNTPSTFTNQVPTQELNQVQNVENTNSSSSVAATSSNDNYLRSDSLFSNIDFGPLRKYLSDDNITDISYSNGGQVWLKSLDKGVYRSDETEINDALIEKIAFQCSNVMGKTFNMAHPFLDSESAELRMNFVHDSIARNGIAAVFRKTPAKIRLEIGRAHV